MNNIKLLKFQVEGICCFQSLEQIPSNWDEWFTYCLTAKAEGVFILFCCNDILFLFKRVFGICYFFFIFILYTYIKVWIKHLNESCRLQGIPQGLWLFFFDKITFPFPLGQSISDLWAWSIKGGESNYWELTFSPPHN